MDIARLFSPRLLQDFGSCKGGMPRVVPSDSHSVQTRVPEPCIPNERHEERYARSSWHLVNSCMVHYHFRQCNMLRGEPMTSRYLLSLCDYPISVYARVHWLPHYAIASPSPCPGRPSCAGAPSATANHMANRPSAWMMDGSLPSQLSLSLVPIHEQ